jgi:Asp-tRNA(Asn)/Glu-tRNA(Gln) amidotransferase A subunit family amidase
MLIQAAPLTTTQDIIATVEQALERLNVVNPHIEAFLPEPNRRERLLREAEQLQQRYPDPANRPSLYGVLVGVKDIYRVDGLPTRAGSSLPPELFEGPQASCVSILKQQGALVLGKTVTTEFAYFEPGPTRNPHNPAHTPGGSSSGSAAAVAAGLCPLAIGSQTIGSVIRPAAFCGIVGLKPSYGRIDPEGVIYVAPSLDHVGLFTQNVAGMQVAASILCRDWQPANTGADLPVLAVPDGPYLEQATPEGLAAFEQQVERLRQAGYHIFRLPVLNNIVEINHRHRELMAYEVAWEHQTWFAGYEPQYRPKTAELIRMGQVVKAYAAAAAKEGQKVARDELESVLRASGADVWISPAATGPAPEGIGSTGDPIMNLPWTHTGVPTVTVPAGKAQNGLPLGLQCASAFSTDEHLLQWAGQIERVFADHLNSKE